MFEIINNLTSWIITAIGTNGSMAIFLGGLIEQVIIPIPSPLITMAGGFLLIPQNIPFLEVLKEALFSVVLPYTLAASLGLGIVYFIAYFGGKPLIEKFKNYLGFSWTEVTRLKKKFKGTKRDKLLIIALRAIPVIPISILLSYFIKYHIFFLDNNLYTTTQEACSLGDIFPQYKDRYQRLLLSCHSYDIYVFYLSFYLFSFSI